MINSDVSLSLRQDNADVDEVEIRMHTWQKIR